MIAGTVFSQEIQVVTVTDGRRGPIGPIGPDGPPGPQGDGYTMLGNWIPGVTYCPLDGVTSRSSMVAGIQSLWIQRDSQPCAPSLVEPYLDPARWSEVGYTDWGDTFGGVWEVIQFNHGFTMIGQPVGYSAIANRYVLADSRVADSLGLAIVREVISADRVVLQSTGLVPNIDPLVIYPGTANWTPGAIYYVAPAQGRLSLDPPADVNYFINPILKVGQVIAGLQSSIALPWTPVATRPLEFLVVGVNKFYFNGPLTTMTGLDLNGNVLSYIPGPDTDVFVNGLNLLPSQFTATDGTSITLTVPMGAADKAEIWTPNQPTDILVQSTTLKLDNIEGQFNGIQTRFALLYGLLPVTIQDVTSVMVYLDVNPQEPDVDYVVIPSLGNPAHADIVFATAPSAGTRFWGIALSPAGSSGLPAGGPAGALLGKLSGASGDVGWITVIFGGTF